MVYHIAKRSLDVVIASFGLIVASPIMAIVALLVRWKMGSPVIFRHPRPGLREKTFGCLKFRTMIPEKDAAGNKLSPVQRVTPLGKVLRRTSLDELPQLWSVLVGDMSLVGPRPLELHYLPRYTSEQRRRHLAKPGITGWAQIHGRNRLDWQSRLALDVWYVDHRSLSLDLSILITTFWTVACGSGVAQIGDEPEFRGVLDLRD